jgi:hypothetical protein
MVFCKYEMEWEFVWYEMSSLGLDVLSSVLLPATCISGCVLTALPMSPLL